MNSHLKAALLCLSVLILSNLTMAEAHAGANISQTQSTTVSHHAEAADPCTTAFNYLVTFYPRWFTYYQSNIVPRNQLVAPNRISPLYHVVVAINDDTLYASTFLDVTREPVIVTVPPTTDVYSVLQLDGYGAIFNGIPSGKPGVYGLTGPGWKGKLPDGVTPVSVPYYRTVLIFRADKYSVTGQDMRKEAERFRENLHAAILSHYVKDHNSGATKILPEVAFAVAFKGIADHMLAHLPIQFLKRLQTAVSSPGTQPLTPDEQALSHTFNALFGDPSHKGQLIACAQRAHAAILADYQMHTIKGTTWINFTNIGAWDTSSQGYLDRSAITEFLQYGNNHDAAVYYHSFLDSDGAPLDGTSQTYILKFSKDQQPDVKRFWSVTAYTPHSIELIANRANKYLVASYTPGLVFDSDGSVTIMMSATRTFPAANWLPIPKGKFNIMLRAYGPQGRVLDNTYVPPPIQRR